MVGWGLFQKRIEHDGLVILDMELSVINRSNVSCHVPDILDELQHQIPENGP
jgi:hypothetical protein